MRDSARLGKSRSAGPGILTAREGLIIGLLQRRLSNKEIGAALGISENTVKFHLSNIYRKLGVANRTQATRFAYAHGLVAPAPADGSQSETVVMKAA